jgi:hypothetical protein
LSGLARLTSLLEQAMEPEKQIEAIMDVLEGFVQKKKKNLFFCFFGETRLILFLELKAQSQRLTKMQVRAFPKLCPCGESFFIL